MKWMRLVSLAFLIMSIDEVQACSAPHPYTWMDLIVPEVNFRETHLTNVVAFFNSFLAESVTNKPPPKITIDPAVFDTSLGGQSIPAVTFTARYVGMGCCMKIITSVMGMSYVASETGAVFTIYSPGNPFETISSTDVVRIVLYEEKFLPRKPEDGELALSFYLKPLGAIITNQSVIASACESLRKAELSRGHPKTGSGLLNYQVFYGKKDRVLAVTSIENYRCSVAFKEFRVDNGILRASGASHGCRSVQFCRIIFDFTKNALPDEFSKLDDIYRAQGGIEKLLFSDVE